MPTKARDEAPVSSTDNTIFDLLKRLDTAKISYRLNSVRSGALMVEVTVPGERWEIEVLEDGSVEVEVFRSDGAMLGADAITDLFARFSD